MSTELLNEDIEVLRGLKNGPTVLTTYDHNVLTRLLIRGIAVRNPLGQLVLTKIGERLLFQKDCREALTIINDGVSEEIKPGVKNWLKSSGFVTENLTSTKISVTNRGQTWLASFDIDGSFDHLAQSYETIASLGVRTRQNDRRFKQ